MRTSNGYVDLAPMYNSLADLGGVMNAASDTQGNAGAGITDTADPSKAPKKKISSGEVDKIVKRSDEIRGSAMSNEDKKIALSELLTDAGIPHDPNSLDPYSPSDNYGLLSNRIEIVDPVSTTAASSAASAGGGSISASDAVQGASGGLESVIADAAEQDAASESASLDSTVAADTDLTGSTEKTAAELEAEAAAAAAAEAAAAAAEAAAANAGLDDSTYTDANGVTWVSQGKHPVSGALIWQAQNPTAQDIADAVQHTGGYTSIEDGGQGVRVLTSEGEVPVAATSTTDNGASTDDTEDTEDTEDTTTTGSGLNITITGAGLVEDVINSLIYGPFQTQAEADAAAAANATTNNDDTVVDDAQPTDRVIGDPFVVDPQDPQDPEDPEDPQDPQDPQPDPEPPTPDPEPPEDPEDPEDPQDPEDPEPPTPDPEPPIVDPEPPTPDPEPDPPQPEPTGRVIGDPFVAPGKNGKDGQDGRDGKDGKDGKDGVIGLFSAIQDSPLTESLLFEPKFTELDNVQLGMFERFLRAAGGRR